MSRCFTCFLIGIGGILGVASCASEAPKAATPLPSLTLPAEILPTFTKPPYRAPTEPPPSASPTETGVPDATLSPVGPYLAYLTERLGSTTLVLADIYGAGRQRTPLPADATDQVEFWLHSYHNPTGGVSPDGTYFAYETGHTESPFDLTLRVIRLADNHTAGAIRVLSNNAATRVEEVAAAAAQDLGREVPDVPREEWPGVLLYSLEAGIRTFEWSPTQSILAFAAQIDGPSSDLYSFHPATNTRRRLTSGPENLQTISWSPNGFWIAHAAAYVVGMGSPVHNFIVSSDGASLLTLPEGGGFSHGWVTSDLYLLYEAANGVGRFDLKAVRPPNPRYVSLWKYPFTSFALDLATDTELVSAMGTTGLAPGVGTYLASTTTGSESRIHGPFNQVVTWGRDSDRFLGIDDAGVYAISDSGKVRTIYSARAQVSISPNREMIVFFDSLNGDPTVLYRAASESLVPVDEGPASCVLWSPDSKSFFLVSRAQIQRYDVPTGQLQQVDEGIVTGNVGCTIRILAT